MICCSWVRHRFDRYAYGIIFCIDEEIKLGFSDRSFEVFNDGHIEGYVTGLQGGINTGVDWCVAS